MCFSNASSSNDNDNNYDMIVDTINTKVNKNKINKNKINKHNIINKSSNEYDR